MFFTDTLYNSELDSFLSFFIFVIIFVCGVAAIFLLSFLSMSFHSRRWPFNRLRNEPIRPFSRRKQRSPAFHSFFTAPALAIYLLPQLASWLYSLSERIYPTMSWVAADPQKKLPRRWIKPATSTPLLPLDLRFWCLRPLGHQGGIRNKTVFDFNFYDLKTAGDDFMLVFLPQNFSYFSSMFLHHDQISFNWFKCSHNR